MVVYGMVPTYWYGAIPYHVRIVACQKTAFYVMTARMCIVYFKDGMPIESSYFTSPLGDFNPDHGCFSLLLLSCLPMNVASKKLILIFAGFCTNTYHILQGL